MIGKCKAVGGSSEGIAYLFQDKQDKSKVRGYELDRNMLIGETPGELLSELKQWNKDNPKDLKNEVFSMVLAPAGDDGKKLSDEKLKIEKLEIDKKELKKQVTDVLKKAKSFNDFSERAKKIGIEIKPTINKQGEVQGYRIKSGKADFKASEIDRNITLSKIDKIFEQNIQQEQKQSIRPKMR